MCFDECPAAVVVSHGAEGLISEKDLRKQFFRVCSIGDPDIVISLLKVKMMTAQGNLRNSSYVIDYNGMTAKD